MDPLMRYILPGSIRSKKNSRPNVPIPAKGITRIRALFGKQWRYAQVISTPSKTYKEWETEARKAAMSQYSPHRYMLDTPVWARVTIYYKGNEPDLSGCLESVGDALEGIAWEDDKQIVSWDGSRKLHSLKDPRTVVEVFRVNECG